MDRIAQLTKETREATFVDRDADGDLIRNTTAIGHLGGGTLDNEENYLIKKLFNSLGDRCHREPGTHMTPCLSAQFEHLVRARSGNQLSRGPAE